MIFNNFLVEPAALGLSEQRYRELRNIYDVQSFVFACEIMPTLWDLYPSGLHTMTMLDVGPRTAAGTALLQAVHHSESFSRIKLRVSAIDIDDTFFEYARIHFPEVEYIVGDIFDPGFTRRFDLVLCSHTLEHIREPLPFLQRMRQISTQWTIVACPFHEQELTPGHAISLGYDFFETAGAHSIKVFRSLTWHQSMACVAVFRADEGGPR